MATDWEMVIGLECHVQLKTASKIFSGSSTAFGAEPNTQANVVDLALPGVLPVMNRRAAEFAIRFGLAIGATITPASVFARKNYFYPDLPKGYQISQYELPVVQGGTLTIATSSGVKTIRLTRAHLEEDAGKSLHEDFHGLSGIDLNRCGTPLLEVVSEPEMRSAEEAVAYARTLHGLVTWLGICDGNLQEGSFRVDANVSVRPRGQQEFGTRCELKNLNSFRFLERAILHERGRQIELIESGGKVVQETRLYDPDRDETRSMRSKEDAHDYRYFPDPDLPALLIDTAWIDEVRASMPELPAARRDRYMAEHGLKEAEATLLISNRATADYFDETVDALPSRNAESTRAAAMWIVGELAARLNRDGIDIDAAPVRPALLAALVQRVQDRTISNKVGRELLDEFWAAGSGSATAADAPPASGPERATEGLARVDSIIETRGLKQVSDDGALVPIVQSVLAANPKSIEEFKAGKEKALNALVGQVMKASGGKANPQQVGQLLRAQIAQGALRT